MKIKLFLILFFLFIFAPTAFGDNEGCCIKNKNLKTISEENCVRNAQKASCLDSSSFFLEGDPECKGGIAASYCPQKSSESELGCCVKNINDTSQYGTSNCQSNTKRPDCTGSNSLFEVTDPDCLKNTSVSKFCTATTQDNKNPSPTEPTTSKGQTETGIVPCGHSVPCTLCHLIVGINNLITWGRNILLVLATLGIVVAGIMYIMAGTVTSAEKAKGALYNALIGFAIIWAAWLIVNTVMVLMSTKENLGIYKENWWTFTCNTVSTATGTQTGQGGEPANPSPAGSTVGCGKVVDAAKKYDAQNCQYSQQNRNSCTGNPAYTDCSNFVDTCYKAAGCSSPGNQSDAIGANGESVGDRSTLKAGDVLWKQGHVAICVADGCGSVIHASGQKDGIKESGGSYVNEFSKVIRASKYCTSCDN